MHDEQCELYCKQCDIPICSCCSLFSHHLGHDKFSITEAFKSKTDELKRDLQELEQSLLPKYQDIVSSIKVQYDDLETKSKNLIRDVHRQGADWHKEVDIIINRKKSEVSEMQNKNIDALKKQENDITLIISEITQIIADLKELLESKDVYNVTSYHSRNAHFRRLPNEIKFTVPSFISQKINTEQLYEQFGSLSGSPLTTEFAIPIQTSLAMPSSPGKPFLYDPHIIGTLNTGYENLNHVTCLSDNELWTQGKSNIMKLYDLQGNLQQSIKTKSGSTPFDIAVTKDGDLAYIDSKDKTVNLIKKTKMQKVSRPRMRRWRKKDPQEIHEMIGLQEWKPLRFCITNSGDFLITMTCDDKEETKLTRYSGFTEKQNIQFDDNGQSLFSYGSYIVYVNENKNNDICVADNKAKAVVVVTQAGKLRFRYTGPSANAFSKESFDPIGITTDSQGRILTADHCNHRIHIIDQDGQFLCYIDNCDFRYPCGLCTDTADNLFVVEFVRGQIKKIRYYM